MLDSIPAAGSADAEVCRLVHDVWFDALKSLGKTPAVDRHVSLAERLIAAQSAGYQIGGVLSRFSSKLQHSTSAQVRDCVQYAAAHDIYVPPEFICVDEGVSGRKLDRDGLNRMKALLAAKLVRVLLVFKVSRLFRVAYKGFQFFQEDIVEEGLRAVSISQGIDTAEAKTWKNLAYLHGIMDEMLVGTIADHVRSGLTNLFRQSFVTGALTLGYRGVEVPGLPTKLGRPRRMPAVDEAVAPLIRTHFELIRDGLPIKEGWRRWVKEGGPHDARSRGRMSYGAYRRMLSNPRYLGRWAFGRTRSEWSTKREYARKVEQPETEVSLIQSDELRIVSDELFFAVQQRLNGNRKGSYGLKRRREPQLWDLVTDCFQCATCRDGDVPARFYQAGAHGDGMRCKEGNFCPQLTVVRRSEAVQAVCARLQEIVARDEALIAGIIAKAKDIDVVGDGQREVELAAVERQIAQLGHKIDDLSELAGDGTAEDRAQLRAKIKGVQRERAERQAERARLQAARTLAAVVINPDDVRQYLADATKLLVDGAAGLLGEENRYRAAELFRQLVGGRIVVEVHRRPGRKLTTVSGKFAAQWFAAAQRDLAGTGAPPNSTTEDVTVWLRRPPLLDELAPRVQRLIDVDGLSYRAAAALLQSEGLKVNNGTVLQMYRRYYEMLGQPVPPRSRPLGRQRRRSGDAET